LFENRLARIERRSAETRRKTAPKFDRIGGPYRRSCSLYQYRENKADGALPQHGNGVAGSQLKELHAFKAGIDRFDPAVLIERHARRYFLHATIDNPIHDPNILRKSAAGRFVARRDPNPLIDCALGIQASRAVITGPARHVMENDNPIPGLILGDAIPGSGDHPGRFMAVDARRRKQIVLNLFEIGVADAAGFHPYEDFIRRNGRRLDVLHRNPPAPGIDGGPHVLRYSLIQPEGWRVLDGFGN
jgi:hypothetical protein